LIPMAASIYMGPAIMSLDRGRASRLTRVIHASLAFAQQTV
jgi:hypothetical protein